MKVRALVIGAAALVFGAASKAQVPVSLFAEAPLVLHGSCSLDSHTTEGLAGTDLAQKQVRFFCDAATIIEYQKDKNRLLIGFSNYGSEHDPVLSFDGELSNPDHLDVTSVSSPKASGEVDEGLCEITRGTGGIISRIFCGATNKISGRREVELVNFFVH